MALRVVKGIADKIRPDLLDGCLIEWMGYDQTWRNFTLINNIGLKFSLGLE